MAYNDSGELPASQSTYSLGGYTFELKVQTVHEPGEPDVVSVFAICRGFDGTRETVPMDFPVGTTVESWSMEVNETAASVYVLTKTQALNVGGVNKPIPYSSVCTAAVPQGTATYNAPAGTLMNIGKNLYKVFASPEPTDGHSTGIDGIQHTFHISTPYTYNGKTVYYYSESVYWPVTPSINPEMTGSNPNAPGIAWYMIYGDSDGRTEDVLIARFAIDIREADTEDWDEPGSDGPPGTTLNVTVTGAMAGSCTGTPSDNGTVKGYGDGGDGGYGGGGGAGASTVIIYEFATSIAESVQQEAISRGPGTGGPGGKGGKGGDGCILIFY